MRTEPLESFVETLPEESDATVDLWLLLPDDELRERLGELQARLPRLDWLLPAPRHFLHVTLGAGDGRALAGSPAAEVRLRGVNCFHEAVVLQVEGEGPAELVTLLQGRRPEPYLAHVTLAYVLRPGPPEALRPALLELRDADLGGHVFTEAVRVRVPASRATIFTPWTVAERVPLTRRTPG